MATLASELSSSNAGVRDAARRAVAKLAELKKGTVAALLAPLRAEYLAPLLAKRLRSLPLLTQVAYVEAISFCIKQTSADGSAPLLPLDAAMVGVLREVLATAMDEEAAGGPRERGRMLGLHVRGVSVEVRLRVACIELLCAAMVYEGLKAPEHTELRNKMIAAFFRCLTVKSQHVVDVARDALAKVVSEQKLQKELLQSSLRPILLNLADYRKLSVPLLHGLARLLDLLSNFFNLTLGEKLLEHLKWWTEPEKIANAKSFKAGDEIKIPCAILSLFHLLPRAPEKFLEKLVHVTMELEKSLPGSTREGRHWSPFREKLVPYMNRHAPEAVVYFLEKIKLGDPGHFKLLRSLVKCAEGTELRNELANSTAALVATTFDAKFTVANPALATQTRLQEAQLRFQGIVLVHTLVKRMPAWLPNQPDVLRKLTDIWLSAERKQRLTSEEQMPLEQIVESKLLIKCFVSYCRHHASEGTMGSRQVELLFMMLSIFSEHTLVNYSFLKTFYLVEVAQEYTAEHKAECIKHLLTFFQTREVAQDDKVQALQLLLLPMLASSFAKGEARAVLSAEAISIIISRLLGGEMLATYDEALRIELLKLATLLIEHVPDQLVEHRKELIKFAWNHLKSEDTQSKQCAYVNVCRFIQVYDTPPKIILQVYVALLRTFQPDARALVKQALDILTPALPKRLPAGDHKYPTWIKWTKKIIVEEGHSLPQLIHIWQLVVRHPSLFFSSSAQFVPQMVNSLNRIGLSPNCSVENRKLAVELAQLIISWELQRCAAAAAAAKRPKPEPSAGAAGAAAGEPPAKQQRVDDAGAKAPTAAGAAPAAAPAAGARRAPPPPPAPPPPRPRRRPRRRRLRRTTSSNRRRRSSRC